MKRPPLGVCVFGALLIYTSIDLLRLLPSYDLYCRINHDWPHSLLPVRFVGSYIFRLIGLVCGIGVLFLNDSARKFLVVFSVYCLFTLPLRHTYSAQLFFSEPIFKVHGSMFSLETFTWIAVICRWVIDGAFSAAVIFYFTRPAVKASFDK